jgi:type I restriction enzyme S subunit
LLEPRDFLISITADIGKIGIVPEDIEEAYINQHVALTRPSDPETTKYLAYYLISPGGGGRQFQELQKGATKAGLTLTNIKEVTIALPPASELKQIVDEVERLLSVADDAAVTAEREHTRAERLRQSILKQAFSGQLVPHEDREAPSIPDTFTAVANGKDE